MHTYWATPASVITKVYSNSLRASFNSRKDLAKSAGRRSSSSRNLAYNSDSLGLSTSSQGIVFQLHSNDGRMNNDTTNYSMHPAPGTGDSTRDIEEGPGIEHLGIEEENMIAWRISLNFSPFSLGRALSESRESDMGSSGIHHGDGNQNKGMSSIEARSIYFLIQFQTGHKIRHKLRLTEFTVKAIESPQSGLIRWYKRVAPVVKIGVLVYLGRC
jgi:hypothetical protein